jgi:adenylate kinase family enzyme
MKILIFGLPGSGKTTFAKKLIEGKKQKDTSL